MSYEKTCTHCNQTVGCTEGYMGLLKCPICGEVLGNVYDSYAPKNTPKKSPIGYALTSFTPSGQEMQWAAYPTYKEAAEAGNLIQKQHPDWKIKISFEGDVEETMKWIIRCITIKGEVVMWNQVYDTTEEAEAAAKEIRAKHPSWQIHIEPEEYVDDSYAKNVMSCPHCGGSVDRDHQVLTCTKCGAKGDTLTGILTPSKEAMVPIFDELASKDHCPKCGATHPTFLAKNGQGIGTKKCIHCGHVWCISVDIQQAFIQAVEDVPCQEEFPSVFADEAKLKAMAEFISKSIKNEPDITADDIKFDGSSWINHAGMDTTGSMMGGSLDGDSYKIHMEGIAKELNEEMGVLPLQGTPHPLQGTPLHAAIKAEGFDGLKVNPNMYVMRFGKKSLTEDENAPWWSIKHSAWVEHLENATQWDEDFVLAHPIPDHIAVCWVGVSDILDSATPDLLYTASELVDAVMGIPCDSNAGIAMFITDGDDKVEVANPSRVFFESYKATALECESDENDDYFNDHFTVEDIGTELEFQMLDDCMIFFDQEHDRIAEFEGIDAHGYNCWERAGACFWLSRQGHGAGFFDCELWSEETRAHLQKIAEDFGQTYLVVGEDGKICA